MRYMSVSDTPGAIALTLILYRPTSFDITSVAVISADLDVA